MKRCVGMLSVLICAALHVAAVSADERPKLNCDRGGDIVKYGGTDWIIYGCSDGKSLVFATAQNNPATPFFFILSPKDGTYQLYGEGTGDKGLTDAAYADLKALTPTQIDALLKSHTTSAGH